MIGTIEVIPSLVLKGESNSIAIREAAKWYKKHLTNSLRGTKTNVPEIVLLTNDQGNLGRSKEMGVTAISSIIHVGLE